MVRLLRALRMMIAVTGSPAMLMVRWPLSLRADATPCAARRRPGTTPPGDPLDGVCRRSSCAGSLRGPDQRFGHARVQGHHRCEVMHGNLGLHERGGNRDDSSRFGPHHHVDSKNLSEPAFPR